MFYGRKSELAKLNAMYQSNKFEMAVIYGRRRIGKTTLINEFCKNKKTIFFAALEMNKQQNLSTLSRAILETDHSVNNKALTFSNFEAALQEINDRAKTEKIVFVIDEYPYLAKADPSFSSLLQHYIDRKFKNSNLMLILCGSSMSFMENQVLGYKSPLYGRRSGQFKIEPFDYYETSLWFKNYSPEDKALVYGITGGIPMYLEQFNEEKTIKQNLLSTIFDKNGYLFEEPSSLIKQEMREPATYNAIIAAIADGKSKLSEITSTVGLDSGLCSRYLVNLIDLGIIIKDTPVTNRKSKRPIYLIDDAFFNFWYKFVPTNLALISTNQMAQYYDTLVAPKLSQYMGRIFEKICRQYLLKYAAPSQPIAEIGQWWGNHKRERRQAQIDIVATLATTKSIIVGACKYRNQPIDKTVLQGLANDASSLNKKVETYYLFSKVAFKKQLPAKFNEIPVKKISLKDIYSVSVD